MVIEPRFRLGLLTTRPLPACHWWVATADRRSYLHSLPSARAPALPQLPCGRSCPCGLARHPWGPMPSRLPVAARTAICGLATSRGRTRLHGRSWLPAPALPLLCPLCLLPGCFALSSAPLYFAFCVSPILGCFCSAACASSARALGCLLCFIASALLGSCWLKERKKKERQSARSYFHGVPWKAERHSCSSLPRHLQCTN